MLTDENVLAALSELLSPGELTQALKHILRVPEAWRQLHEPGFLEHYKGSEVEAELVPAQIALKILGLTGQSSIPTFPDALEARLTHLMQGPVNISPSNRDFKDIALLSVGVARRCETEEGLAKFAHLALHAPEFWRSPLACAWPLIKAPENLLSMIINESEAEGIALVSQVLLANMLPDEAAKILFSTSLTASSQTLLHLRGMGESGLAEAFARAIEHSIEEQDERPATSSVEKMLDYAARQLACGDVEAARECLNQAWEAAAHTAGSVADQVAEVAYLDNDPVLETEARQHALRYHPTPQRRSWLALALLEVDKIDEAMEALQPNPECIEEQIATGLTLARFGEAKQARQTLSEVIQQLPQINALDHRLLDYLVDGLQSAGEADLALQVAHARARLTPDNIPARIDLARLLRLAGDPLASAEQATLALALAPDSIDARQELAQSLQDGGRPEAALPHWQILAISEPSCLEALAACALDAGQYNLAHDTAREILDANSDSINGHILLGKVLTAIGNHEDARDHLEKVIQLAPQNSETWIALAESQMAAGDEQAAGNTLSAGIQLNAKNAGLQIALARWLRRQRRVTDALEVAKKAVEFDSENAQWLLEYGDILRELGHHDEALPVLREALARQPENFEARQALALAYEQRGEFSAAARLLYSLPSAAPPHAHLFSGRIMVKSASQGNEDHLDKGLQFLEQARTTMIEDSSLDFWLGRAYELDDQFDQALLAYQKCLQNPQDENQSLVLDAVLGAGRMALATDQPPLALSTLEAARERFPASADLLVGLAQAYLEAELPNQALHAAHQAVDLDPNQKTLRMLGQAASSSGAWEKAIQAVQRLVEMQPDDAFAWLDLAETTRKAGKNADARCAVARSLRLGRRSPMVLQKAASTLAALGHTTSAQRMLRQAAQLSPDDVEAHQQLATISEQLGDLETTQQALCRCIDLQPENHRTMSHAAQVLWDLDRRSAAIGLWQRAVNLNPKDADLHAKLANAHLSNGEYQQGLNHYALALEQRPDDPDLTIEAGRAALRYGTADEAFETLQKAIRLAPDKIDPLVDMGECLLKLHRPEDACVVLKEATLSDSAPQRAFALLSHASLETDGLPSAQAAFEAAQSSNTQTIEDAIWFSRTAMRLGEWQIAVDALEGWHAHSKDPSLIIELARLRLRLMDARWLYADAAQAVTHAPPQSFTSSQSRQEISKLIEHGRQAGIYRSTLAALETWFTITGGNFDEKRLQDQKAYSHAETSSEIAHALAIAYLRMNRPDDAIAVLTENSLSLDIDSWTPILLGLSYAARGFHSQARQAYQVACQNPVIDPIAHYLGAHAWWTENQADEATAEYNEALVGWPNEPAWHFQLASLYQEKNDADSALPHLQQAVELAPEEGDYLLSLARAFSQSGHLSEAEKIYTRALDAMPSLGQVWKEAGQLALATGNSKLAETWFERACTLLPSDAQCLIGTAQAKMRLGQHRQALEQAQAAVRLSPDDLEVLLGMGEIFTKQGSYDKALIAYDKALTQTKDPVSVQLARAKLLIQTERAGQAAADLRSVVERVTDDHRAWAVLAEAHEADEDIESALEAASKSVRLAPRDPSYRLLLGRLCRKSGQLDRALDELTQAQTSSPTDTRLPLELGRVYEDRREPVKALEAFQRAVALNPDCEQAHFHAGLILKQRKAYQQAAQMFERCVELNPKDSNALHQLATVQALELVHGGIHQPAVAS